MPDTSDALSRHRPAPRATRIRPSPPGCREPDGENPRQGLPRTGLHVMLRPPSKHWGASNPLLDRHREATTAASHNTA
jgi:hypothetical protein